MKFRLFIFTVALFAIVLFPSCKKDLEDILVNKGGKWDIVMNHHTETVLSVQLDTIVYDYGTVTFTEDGKSIFIVNNPSSGLDTMLFDWTADGDKKSVVCIDTMAHDTLYWVVERSSNKEQLWSNLRTDSINGSLRTTTDKITLHRAK